MVAALTLGGMSACKSAESTKEVKQESSSKGQKEEKNQKSKSYEMTLESTEYTLPEEDSAPLNGRVLKVKVSIKNIGKEALRLSPDDFALYVKDEKMKAYSKYDEDRLSFDVVDPGRKVSGAIYFDVKEASSYELEYKKHRTTPSEKEKPEKIKFVIDGKKLTNKAKALERPAKALEAYLNAGFYDKDIDKMKDLTGEDGAEFQKMVAESVKKSSLAGSSLSGMTEESLDIYFKNFKTALQKNVKFETKVISMDADGRTAEVEIKAKPLALRDLRPKVEAEQKRIQSENPNISYDELKKQVFEYASSQLPEVGTSSVEESAVVKMNSNGDDRWRLDDSTGDRISRILYTY